MTIWWLLFILGCIFVTGCGFIYLIVALHRGRSNHGPNLSESAQKAAEEDVEHIFNEEFREELRNRGRVHFEKILG